MTTNAPPFGTTNPFVAAHAVSVGLLPSCVMMQTAPLVADVQVDEMAAMNVPPFGEKVGVATAGDVRL